MKEKTYSEVLEILESLLKGSKKLNEQLFCQHEINYVTHNKEHGTFDFNAFVKGLNAYISNHDNGSPRDYIQTYVDMSKKLLEILDK